MIFDFEHRLAELGAQTVLGVGDLMLDEFVYGEVSRISPEAPAPVIAVARQEAVIGGAGNVARNVASLGSRCLFVGVIGDDDGDREGYGRIEPIPAVLRQDDRSCDGNTCCCGSVGGGVEQNGSYGKVRFLVLALIATEDESTYPHNESGDGADDQ